MNGLYKFNKSIRSTYRKSKLILERTEISNARKSGVKVHIFENDCHRDQTVFAF